MKRLLCLVLTGPAVFLLAVSVFMLGSSAAAQPSASAVPRAAYTLGEKDGRLALYRSGESAPVAQYDIYTALLPERDAEQLRRGIAVQSEAELRRYLEDFGL